MKIFILLLLIFNVVFAETKLIRQNASNKTVLLELKNGWNLVSLPGYQSYFATTFFDAKNVDRILSYNKYINQWMSYYANNTDHFSSLVLHPGVGYWIKASYNFNIAISSDYETSVTNLTDDELAEEILDVENDKKILVNGVTWMKYVFRHVTFQEAQKECQNNKGRLPTIEELYNFYNHTSISSEHFTGEHVYYWTASQLDNTRKWILDFSNGYRALQHVDTYNSARCLLY